METVSQGHYDIAKMMLDCGAPLDCQDKETGETALLIAIRNFSGQGGN